MPDFFILKIDKKTKQDILKMLCAMFKSREFFYGFTFKRKISCCNFSGSFFIRGGINQAQADEVPAKQDTITLSGKVTPSQLNAPRDLLSRLGVEKASTMTEVDLCKRVQTADGKTVLSPVELVTQLQKFLSGQDIKRGLMGNQFAVYQLDKQGKRIPNQPLRRIGLKDYA